MPRAALATRYNMVGVVRVLAGMKLLSALARRRVKDLLLPRAVDDKLVGRLKADVRIRARLPRRPSASPTASRAHLHKNRCSTKCVLLYGAEHHAR
ncbi:hypothetical protein NKH18_38245 [Streptomyces sp. M10(2022)]